MAKFTKKPKVIDAEQWTGDNFDKIQNLVGVNHASFSDGALTVILNGRSMFITRGTFIVKEAKDDEPLIFSEFKFKLLYSPKK